MRVSLTAEACAGNCSKCGTENILVIPFTLIVDDHAGEADALCKDCLFYPNGAGVNAVIPMRPLVPGPAPRKKALRKNRQTSDKLAREVMEELGARVQPGSGNQPGAKGDGRKKGKLRVEHKYTSARSYSMHIEDLYKIASECGDGEKPVLVIDYVEPGTRKLQDRFAVVHFNDLKELLDAPRNNR